MNCMVASLCLQAIAVDRISQISGISSHTCHR
jgi:hypothetical protein